MQQSTNKHQQNAQPPALLDFEASALDGHPVEVAWSLPDGRIETWLIRPEPHWQHWSQQAMSLHGITPERALEEGRPAAWVARRMVETLGAGAVLYCDAGLPWDQGWLEQLFAAADRAVPFTLVPYFPLVARTFGLSELQIKRLRREGRAGLRTHRAAGDVAALVNLWQLARREAAGWHFQPQPSSSYQALPSRPIRVTAADGPHVPAI